MCGSEYNVQRQRGNTILRQWNDSKRMSFGHADRNMCVSAGILLVSVESVMNTSTKSLYRQGNTGIY